MSRGQQRRLRARVSQQRATKKAQRRRVRKAGTSGVAAATAVALGLTVTTAAPAAAATTGDSAQLVADINALGPSNPEELTRFRGAIYFGADDGVHGRELWKTDGTAAGTVLVKDAFDGAGSGYPNYLAVAGDNLFFQASDGSETALWKTDGTAAGTVKVAPVTREDNDHAAIGNTLIFASRASGDGLELWRSDGTTDGTVLIEDINPGTYDYYGDVYPLDSNPGYFTRVGGKVFFAAVDGVHGDELWSTDGTAEGTAIVADIAPDDSTPAPRNLTVLGNTLFFQADDGVTGRELWKSDGTAVGTVLVKDTFPGVYNDGRPSALTNVNGTLYFTAFGATDSQVWKSNGTTAGTVPVKGGFATHPSYSPADFTSAAGRIFFRAGRDDSRGSELWRTDGSSSGTALVADLYPGTHVENDTTYPNSGFPDELTAMGGKLVFAGSSASGRELFSSNGTAEGTTRIDINPGAASGNPEGLGLTGTGTLVMSAADAVHGQEIFRFLPGKAVSNAFTLPRKGRANTRKGTVAIEVSLPGAGRLALAPQGAALVKATSRTVAKGRTTLTIKPSRAGKKRLRANLARALEGGRTVGKLKVSVAVTFTPTGGVARTIAKTYTLKLS